MSCEGAAKIAPVPYSISTKLATLTAAPVGIERMERLDAGIEAELFGRFDDFLRGCVTFASDDEHQRRFFGFLLIIFGRAAASAQRRSVRDPMKFGPNSVSCRVVSKNLQLRSRLRRGVTGSEQRSGSQTLQASESSCRCIRRTCRAAIRVSSASPTASLRNIW